MRRVGVAVALSLAWCGLYAPAYAAQVPPAVATVRVAPRVLVSGVPAGSSGVQKIIDQAYGQVAPAASSPAALSDAQRQQLLTAINAALHKAGYVHAHAYLSSQLAAFALPGTSQLAGTPQPVATITSVLPPVKGRTPSLGAAPVILVHGFVVQGVGKHPDAGITPASIQKLADAQFAKLGGSATQPVRLDFAQLQAVADAITKYYRAAGLIVATAYLPAQTVGKNGMIDIDVLEGHIGRIVVHGAKHYRPWVIAAPAQALRGKVLQKDDLLMALRYDKDLPGVAVSATLQPGKKTGQTDLILRAHEKSPLALTLGASNYGTPVTGRYRAQAALDWYSPLGLGDELSVGVNYALDPHQDTYGSLTYSFPTVKVPGFGFVVGANRSELQLDSGSFAVLDIQGPTSRYFGGLHWKFVNTRSLSMTASLRYIHEESKLSSLDFTLSDERFNLAQLSFSMQHNGKRSRGMDFLSVAVRKSLTDDSATPDLVSPNHASDFLSARVRYKRIQFLTLTQRLVFRLSGQYTNDPLVPMEQFAIGGPDSMRAWPITASLADRGYYTALEYQIDAPGFADKPSPFHGIPWRNLLTFEAFVEYARGYQVGPDNSSRNQVPTYRDYGAGLIFRLPSWHHLFFHLDVAAPLGNYDTSHDNGYQVYGRFTLTF